MASGFINRLIYGQSAKLIAKKASSPQAFENGVAMAFTQKEGIEIFFRKYGSTEKKFDYYPNPEFYIGYVKIDNQDEFLTVVLISESGSVVSSFWPDLQNGQDFFGLMRKKEFVEFVASKFVEAGSE